MSPSKKLLPRKSKKFSSVGEHKEFLRIGEILCNRKMVLGKDELLIPFPQGEESGGQTLHALFGLFSSAVKSFESRNKRIKQ